MTNVHLPRPSELAPRLWAWTRAAVARGGTRARSAGAVAVCETAGEHRSYAEAGGTAVQAVTGRSRCEDALPDGSGRRERAREAVAAHATGQDGLAALLDMLALHPGQDGERERPGHRAAGEGTASDGA